MATLLDTINNTREEVIAKHFAAADAELKDKTAAEPLKTLFYIYSGCVSKSVTEELAFRFNQAGFKATPFQTFLGTHYLYIWVPLPEKLIHEEKKQEDKPIEESKEEEKQLSEAVAESS